jgi:hypothetical protein
VKPLPKWFREYLYPLNLFVSMKKRAGKSFIFDILIRSKYLLNIINKIISMVGPLSDLIYTYKQKEIIILI